MAVIGNRIERLLDINPDKKGWILTPEQKQQLKAGRASVSIDQPNLFGGDKKEGGWVGAIDVYVGEDGQSQNTYLAKQIDEDVSAYPNLSYLVFHAHDSLDKGFQLVSMSGMMKEFMLWVKRTRIKNDGNGQWYERNLDGEIVCEIDSRETIAGTGDVQPFKMTLVNTQTGFRTNNKTNILDITHPKNEPFYIDYKGPHGYYYYNQGNVMDDYELLSKVDVRPFGEYICTAEVNLELNARNFEYNFSGGYEILSTTHSIREINPKTEWFKIVVEFDASNPFIISTDVKGGIISYESGARNLTGAIEIDFISLKHKEKKVGIEAYDINPIHKIREILTDYTAMGKPESEINNENFRFMADRIYEERLGISWCIQQKSCKEALEELEYHIEGGVRINRQTGLYEVILFRDDLLNLDDALHFDESNIKSFQPDIINAEDQINAINVSFYDRENIKDSSFSLSDVGSFHTIDHENAEDLKFPYFMTRRNAEMVANWKLKQLSTMAWKGTFTTGKYEARRLNKYDVVLLSWKSKNIVNLPVRVMNINLGNGRDNTVTLDFVEVVPYSNISYSSINVDPNPNPILPPQPNSNIVFEMPYFEAVQRMGQTSVDTELANNPEIGYLMAAAIKPQNNSLNALLFTDGGTGIYTNFEESGVVEYCATCNLDQNISHTDESFAIKSVKDLSRVKLGTLVQIDDELLVYENYESETKVITVRRGALDTIPKPHLKDAVFYFWDDSSGLDPTLYVEGEVVNAQVLTTTPSGIENLDTGNVQNLEIVGRANRPYPPANVKINNEYYPDEVTGDLVISWVDRNRIQQTGGNILGFFDGGVTREAGVTYNAVVYDAQSDVKFAEKLTLTSNTATFEQTESLPPLTRLELYAVRDGFESYQKFQHIFAWGEQPEAFITAFTANGIFTVPKGVTQVDILVVAGGGGGGSRQGGGGGAGGIIVLSNHSVTPGGSIPIIVGGGGAGGINGGPGTNGENSIFGTVVATGGGGGGGRTTGNNGRVGGSGGGSHLGAPGEATGLQGNKGGTGFKGNKGGGGGGGASAGQDNLRPDGSKASFGEADHLSDAGDGGDGLFFPNLAGYGENGYFAGGGGGGGFNTASGAGEGTGGAGKGGTGGGGGGSAGSNSPAITGGPGHDAMPNTGGGGGGSAAGNFSGGAGGSGIVIIVYSAGQLQPIISAKSAVSEIL